MYSQSLGKEALSSQHEATASVDSDSTKRNLSRRRFLGSIAGATVGLSAASYARISGANDRISIGIIGCGGRGQGTHMAYMKKYSKSQNVEVTAVCDPWTVRRQQAAAKAKKHYGREARQFVSYRDLLQLDDVDAVMIASCDHQHTTHLRVAAETKKDVYCEKPLGMELGKLKAACDAVKRNHIVIQIGTQQRSYPTNSGTREVCRSGILGTVSRIEQHRHASAPYWLKRVKSVDESEVDWQEFLMDHPDRPFDPVKFSAWYGFLEFSDGPVSQWGSHYIDLVHYITGARFPSSCVCLGGTFTWKDEHNFTCPDHVQTQWIYPEGFMVSYATNFGNSAGKSFKIFGDVGMIDLGGPHAPTHFLSAEGGRRNKGAIRGRNAIETIDRPDHWLDWLQCLRSRQQCHAPIEAGYQHAVACIMARQSFGSGHRMVYNPDKREIRSG